MAHGNTVGMWHIMVGICSTIRWKVCGTCDPPQGKMVGSLVHSTWWKKKINQLEAMRSNYLHFYSSCSDWTSHACLEYDWKILIIIIR